MASPTRRLSRPSAECPAVVQQGRYAFRPHWPAQKIALRDVASLDAKEVQLQLLLDSFSHDLQTKPSTECNDGVHDFFRSRVPSQSGNEGAVDLRDDSSFQLADFGKPHLVCPVRKRSGWMSA